MCGLDDRTCAWKNLSVEWLVLLTAVLFEPLSWGWLVLFPLLNSLSAAAAAPVYIFFISERLSASSDGVPRGNIVSLMLSVPTDKQLRCHTNTLPDGAAQRAPMWLKASSFPVHLPFHSLYLSLCNLFAAVCGFLFPFSCVWCCACIACIFIACPLVFQTTCCCCLCVLWWDMFSKSKARRELFATWTNCWKGFCTDLSLPSTSHLHSFSFCISPLWLPFFSNSSPCCLFFLSALTKFLKNILSRNLWNPCHPFDQLYLCW